MKFKIVYPKAKYVPMTLKDGWCVVNETNEYLDLEKQVAEKPLPDGEKIYFILRVSFASSTRSWDWDSAYLVFEENVPDGNHIHHMSVGLTVEDAMKLCLNEY